MRNKNVQRGTYGKGWFMRVYVPDKARIVYVCIGTGKCMLEGFLQEWCLVVIVDVRTYD